MKNLFNLFNSRLSIKRVIMESMEVDLSLDDIIKSKKKGGAKKPQKWTDNKTLPLRNTLNKPSFKRQPKITDARIKIIQKNRAKIRDARDRLSEITRANGDARKRLIAKQLPQSSALKNGGMQLYTRSYYNGNIPGRQSVYKIQHPLKARQSQFRHPSPRLPNVVAAPRGYVDYDNMNRMEEEEYVTASRLSRTVKNDMTRYGAHIDNMSPPPRRHQNSWGSGDPFDPFDVYEVRERRLSTEILPPPPKGILRSSSRQISPEPFQRRFIPETSSHLSYEMRSRLERAPDPHASVGIFSNPLKSSTHMNPSGYRIVVSNLHTSVTQSDIQELFEDIGELYDSRLVRPGIAEVVYKSLADAEKAVDTYHNRQLDGQPMKCLLVNPRSSNKPTAPAIKSSSSSSRHDSGKTPLEIDIDALHKVLFRR